MILLIGGCGYIGSRIFRSLGDEVHVIDVQRRGNPGNIPHSLIDYWSIPHATLQNVDTIVLLAAHSSVGDAKSNPTAAFYNNVVAFQTLLERLGDDQRLIYASSSSIYSGFGAFAASEDIPNTGNMYDFSKMADDALAALSGKRCYGLRFGTVNGPSPNIRNDLMLNKMVINAIDEGQVVIQNPKISRPILGINDLTRAIRAIIDGDGEPGIYNLASFNSTVAHLGAVVADALDVPLVLGASSPAYDFTIATTKFQEAYDFQFEETATSIVNDLVGERNGGVS